MRRRKASRCRGVTWRRLPRKRACSRSGFQQSYNKTGIQIPNPALAGDKINFLIENNYTSLVASYQQWLKPSLKLFTAAAFSNNTDDISWGNFPVARDDHRLQGRGEVLWLPKTRLSLLVGTEVQQYRFLQKFDSLAGSFQELMPAGYVETQFKPKGWIGFKLGGRAEYSTLLGRGNIAPRASAAIKTGEHSQVSLAGGYFYQSAPAAIPHTRLSPRFPTQHTRIAQLPVDAQ